MEWKTILTWYFGLWFITVPLSIFLIYLITTELLDLIFNTGKINQLLKHSDTLNITPLLLQHEGEKEKQSSLSKSILMELDRQISYTRLTEEERKRSWSNRINDEVKEKVISAKRVSDIFKIG
ncbi:MAG: hypothetical protein V9F02_10715 [Chitinophagaceae bacterium]